MLPFYFHNGSGSKSAPWGLKHWPPRAALATKTDGNPPANPSTSQPIITSLWPRALLPNPHPPPPRPNYLPVLLLSLLSKRKDDASLITISKISHKIRPHGPTLAPWQGGHSALRFQMSLIVKTVGGEAIFCCSPAKHWQVFLTQLQSCSGEARLNRHALTTLQCRPIKKHIHRFTARNSFNDLLFPWFNTLLLQHSLFYSGLCWATTKKSFCWVWMHVKCKFDLLALTQTWLNWTGLSRYPIEYAHLYCVWGAFWAGRNKT